MQNLRTIENLIIHGEDFIYCGDIAITGKLEIINANLIVSGELTIDSKCKVNVIKGDIVAGSIYAEVVDICILDGDICTMNGDLHFQDINSNGIIEVAGDSYVSNVICFNYLVNGNSFALNITAIEDIYILGNSSLDNIVARDVLIAGNSCEIFGSYVKAKTFESNCIIGCNAHMCIG